MESKFVRFLASLHLTHSDICFSFYQAVRTHERCLFSACGTRCHNIVVPQFSVFLLTLFSLTDAPDRFLVVPAVDTLVVRQIATLGAGLCNRA